MVQEQVFLKGGGGAEGGVGGWVGRWAGGGRVGRDWHFSYLILF